MIQKMILSILLASTCLWSGYLLAGVDLNDELDLNMQHSERAFSEKMGLGAASPSDFGQDKWLGKTKGLGKTRGLSPTGDFGKTRGFDSIVFDRPVLECEIYRRKKMANGRVKGLGGLAWDDNGEELRARGLVLFDTDSDRIKPESFSILNNWGTVLRQSSSNTRFLVQGHADSTGENLHNFQLSLDRAQSVIYYLITQSRIDPDRLIQRGCGEEKPIASNNTDKGRATNRRVAFVRVQ